MRPIVLVLASLLLCACTKGGDTAPFIQSRLPPGAPASAWPPAGWAWGLLKLEGKPAVRYGVSAPSAVPIGDVIILPGYGESAEWWFETARDLNRESYTVWIMDGVGQGGSGRAALPRDLGHLTDFNDDIAALAVMVKDVVRPPADRPVRIVASGAAGLTALAAIEKGLPAQRLIFSAPVELAADSGGAPGIAAKVGFSAWRARGEKGWSRPAQKTSLTPRQKIAYGWAVANPDLRMGGPSIGWLIQRKKLREAALKPGARAAATVPAVVLSSDRNESFCRSLARCMQRPLPAKTPYHLADDDVRSAWIAALIAELSDHAT